MGKLFGTDGVRGVYGTELTDDLAKRLGYCGTKVLSQEKTPKVIIARDTRESGPALEKALCEGITAAGGEVLLAGVIATPAAAVLVRELGADLAAVISASHNPYEFNGIKFFSADGYKLPDAVEDEIEACLESCGADMTPHLENVRTIENAESLYLDFVKKAAGRHSLKDKKIVLDCSNGANAEAAPHYFKALGAQVTVIGNEPDGTNINKNCGSTHLQALQQKVVEEQADFGIAFDGDADRCLAVDETGAIIDGDQIINLLAREMKTEGVLPHDTAVVTVMSNLGLPLALDEAGISCLRTDVGDRYVLEAMKEHGYALGGEQSGHIIRLDKNTTGDGLLTAAMLADIFAADERSPHELAGLMKIYPQVLINAKVPNDKKNSYLENPKIAQAVAGTEAHFNGEGRVLIRPSGTEPLVRVMIEGKDQGEIEQIARETADLIEKEFSE